MPQVPGTSISPPKYPALQIWDKIIEILRNDEYIGDGTDGNRGQLWIEECQGSALYDLPLPMDTIIFSDTNQAVAVWHENQVVIDEANSAQVDNYTFYIDVAAQDEETKVAINKVIQLCRDIIYTLELNQNLDGLAIIMPSKRINPTETLPYERMFVFMSTITLTIKNHFRYR